MAAASPPLKATEVDSDPTLAPAVDAPPAYESITPACRAERRHLEIVCSDHRAKIRGEGGPSVRTEYRADYGAGISGKTLLYHGLQKKSKNLLATAVRQLRDRAIRVDLNVEKHRTERLDIAYEEHGNAYTLRLPGRDGTRTFVFKRQMPVPQSPYQVVDQENGAVVALFIPGPRYGHDLEIYGSVEPRLEYCAVLLSSIIGIQASTDVSNKEWRQAGTQ
jgi:hypothetical protein